MPKIEDCCVYIVRKPLLVGDIRSYPEIVSLFLIHELFHVGDEVGLKDFKVAWPGPMNIYAEGEIAAWLYEYVVYRAFKKANKIKSIENYPWWIGEQLRKLEKFGKLLEEYWRNPTCPNKRAIVEYLMPGSVRRIGGCH